MTEAQASDRLAAKDSSEVKNPIIGPCAGEEMVKAPAEDFIVTKLSSIV